MIALTFDDGPNEPYTRQILEVLAEYGARATFFVIGKWVRQAPEVVREIAAAGHQIGNHTETHPQMSSLPLRYAILDGMDCTAAIYQCMVRPSGFRAPFGDIPKDFPIKHTHWDIHGSDWAAEFVESITEPIFSYLDEHKGGIVLLHDGYYKEFGADRSKTVEATRRILERYKGQKFVTVSELQNS